MVGWRCGQAHSGVSLIALMRVAHKVRNRCTPRSVPEDHPYVLRLAPFSLQPAGVMSKRREQEQAPEDIG